MILAKHQKMRSIDEKRMNWLFAKRSQKMKKRMGLRNQDKQDQSKRSIWPKKDQSEMEIKKISIKKINLKRGSKQD